MGSSGKHGRDGFTSLTKAANVLEWSLSPNRQNDANKGFVKMLVQNTNDKIIGFHFLGPNAGEVLQGMAVAIKAGATRADVEDTVAIHPTTAETMCMLGGEVVAGVKIKLDRGEEFKSRAPHTLSHGIVTM